MLLRMLLECHSIPNSSCRTPSLALGCLQIAYERLWDSKFQTETSHYRLVSGEEPEMALTIPSINSKLTTVKTEDKRSDENLSKTGMRVRSDWIMQATLPGLIRDDGPSGYVPLGKGRR